MLKAQTFVDNTQKFVYKTRFGSFGLAHEILDLAHEFLGLAHEIFGPCPRFFGPCPRIPLGFTVHRAERFRVWGLRLRV